MIQTEGTGLLPAEAEVHTVQALSSLLRAGTPGSAAGKHEAVAVAMFSVSRK